VPLAEATGGVSVHAQHLSHRGGLGRDDGVVTGKAVGHLGDATHVHRVMIATGQQRGARGRTQRRGVEAVVTQARARHQIEAGRGHRTTEGAERPEADVVENDDEDVRRIG